MAIGNTRQTFKTDILMQLKRPFAQLASGGAGQCTMQRHLSRLKNECLLRNSVAQMVRQVRDAGP